jgi:hypothetical protein
LEKIELKKMNKENDDFEKYLENKKAELRKLKDSDFVETSFYTYPKIVNTIDIAMDTLAKRHEMDTMDNYTQSLLGI